MDETTMLVVVAVMIAGIWGAVWLNGSGLNGARYDKGEKREGSNDE